MQGMYEERLAEKNIENSYFFNHAVNYQRIFQNMLTKILVKIDPWKKKAYL